MHVWCVWLRYRGAIGWHSKEVRVLARDGDEVLSVLRARFPLGVELQQFIVEADEPRILW